MKVAIFSRPGACFPNVISMGLQDMLNDLDIESRIFYESIPMLMRLLPLNKKPKRWYNNLQFRIRNKLSHFICDRKLLREIRKYDLIILSECYPNAFWKNYLAIKELRYHYKGRLISYTDCPLDAAPAHRRSHLDNEDYDESLYDYNLFLTERIEVKAVLKPNQAAIGVSLNDKHVLRPSRKNEFLALVDFAQSGYEAQRNRQLTILKKLGIKFIALEGKYSVEEIRNLYSRATVFFIAFPETFGLPISECLASGTYIFTPDSSWPMAWRLDENPVSMGPGILPTCFKVYNGDLDLENKLKDLLNSYNLENTPADVFNTYIQHYGRFYYGDMNALKEILSKIKKRI